MVDFSKALEKRKKEREDLKNLSEQFKISLNTLNDAHLYLKTNSNKNSTEVLEFLKYALEEGYSENELVEFVKKYETYRNVADKNKGEFL
ncbi:MAG: hypothetical protein RSE41_09030 [Clostridia bacterium]